LPESKYNKEDITICVVNALSGTIPILLKEKFPKARIVCAEYFEYFKDHLIRLGFEVIDVRENNDGKLRIKDHNNMKFNVVIGNPPYQSTDQEGKRNDKAKNLWSKFVLKGLELIKKDGTISMIVPSTWLSPSADIGKGTTGIRFLDIFTAGQLEYVNVGDIGKHFPNIGLHFSHFMYTNTNTERYLTRVKTPTEEFDFDFRDVKYVPNTFSKLAISILNTVLYDDRKKFDFVSTNFKGMVSKLDGGCYDVFHTSAVNGIKKSSTKSVNHHNKKVIVSSSSVYAPYYDTGTVSCSVMTMSCVFDDRDDLAKIKTILSSKLYQYVVEHTIYGGWVSYEAIRRLPLLDITKFWTDEEIYEEFKLTPEEIREVETYTYLDGKHPKRVLS
jgi:site-specific DNA-methyltransferase (adenine-specific)